jgi:NADPH-dependent 2,4-dienoyl-CoA reductase/sulfur reductase-like enzyme
VRFLIIGGSDAGISAALRAQQLDPSAEIEVILADAFPNYSICGLPFYLSGETPEWQQLAHRTEFPGIDLLTETRATQVDSENRRVKVLNKRGNEYDLSYDRLLIATGAVPISPRIAGLEHPGVFLLHTMQDSFQIHEYLAMHNVRSAVVIGSGYIGLEMADALVHRGLSVTLIGRSEAVLPTVDLEFGVLVEEVLTQNGVKVLSGVAATTIQRYGTSLHVSGEQGFSVNGDIVIIGAGVMPDTVIASACGVKVGAYGAVCVNNRMETNLPGIYAAGDCVETWHRLLQKFTYLPLGTTSHKQGRVAGENAVGGDRQFAGSLGTQVVKVFDLAIARTGLRESEAAEAGFGPKTVASRQWDHKAYYPGARELNFRITGDDETGRLLGAQLLGHWQASLAKRIDIFAAAIFHEMTAESFNDLDLSYTPPLGSPWDAVQLAAQAWSSRSALVRQPPYE